MIKELLNEVKKSCFSILPIFFLIIVLILFNVVDLSGYEIFSFSLATIFIIIGVTLFNYGAEKAMTPIGKIVGKGLTKQGKIYILLLVVFIFGFLITIAEPDLSVLALQTESVFNKWLLIISIAFGVGLFLLLAILKIVKKIDLMRILSFLYLLGFSLIAILVYQGKEAMIGLCFDSGGVTTGPMTVPFLMALGSGVAGVLALRSEKDASFGFIAFSSIGPIIVMLLLSIFSNGIVEYELADYTLSNNFILSYLTYFWEKLKSVGLAIFLLVSCFLVTNFIFLKLPKKRVVQLLIGMLFAYLGLSIFLAAVDSTYMGVGYKIGVSVSNISVFIVIIISFAIGALTVLAEPAIKILTDQVQDMTNGLIKKRSLLFSLAFGVGISIVVALLRIKFKFSLLYVVIPGYILCFALSFFVPKIYTAIAFDAGGVASGPLTSSFILPIALGYCASLNGIDSILSYGFGVVSLVALSPLLAVEILGIISNVKNMMRQKKEIKLVLKDDDKAIIYFGE